MKHIDVCYRYNDDKKIGDKIILTEVPENLHSAGYKFINKSKNPFLKYNPFVFTTDDDVYEINFQELDSKFINKPEYIVARSHLLYKHLGIDTTLPKLRSPKFYIYENNKKENIILIHTTGKGICLPNWIIDHVCSKYNKNFRIIQIVPPNEERIPNVEYKDFDFYNDPWEEVAEIASKSIMFIGVDSWVSHMAQAYTSNVNILIPKDFILIFENQSRPWGTGATVGNIWLHPNNYYFNETDYAYGYTNSYLTL